MDPCPVCLCNPNLPRCKLSCACGDQAAKLCSPCVKSIIRSNGELKCPFCRIVVDGWTEVKVCKVTGVKRKLNDGIDVDDARYRWSISYVAGMKKMADGRVLYKVVWKSEKY